MLGYIQKLQQESESKKRRAAFVISAVVTGIILVIWLSTFSIRFTNFGGAKNTAQVKSPIDSLGQNFSEGLEEFKRGVTETNPFTAGVGSTYDASDFNASQQASSEANVEINDAPGSRVIISDPVQGDRNAPPDEEI